MTRHLHRTAVLVALVITAALVAPGGATAKFSPSDAAQATPAVTPQRDLRTPDARDAADRVTQSTGSVSIYPDDRQVTPTGSIQPPAPTTVAAERSSSFDWGDAGIGAGAAVALCLVALGCFLIAAHRRGGHIDRSGPSILAG